MKEIKIEEKKIAHSLIFSLKKQSPVVFYKGVLKTFKKFTEKYLCWNVLFLLKLQSWGLCEKRDSDSVFFFFFYLVNYSPRHSLILTPLKSLTVALSSKILTKNVLFKLTTN